ncbi:MAG: hypothetical protein WBB32_14600 [Flavobacteriales bacterium]|nr:hypothetical protein [Flavobacteriales bacterium]
MRDLLQNWNFPRVLRLVLAGAFLGAGISSGEWLPYVAAGILGMQAIFNVGCCGAACAVPPVNRKANGLVQEVDHVEVK